MDENNGMPPVDNQTEQNFDAQPINSNQISKDLNLRRNIQYSHIGE